MVCRNFLRFDAIVLYIAGRIDSCSKRVLFSIRTRLSFQHNQGENNPMRVARLLLLDSTGFLNT